MRRPIVKLTALAAAIGAGIAVARSVGRRSTDWDAMRERIDSQRRWVGGHLQGAAYRLQGRQPDPEVSDDVLVDRIRSELGPLEKRLDVPHVHVMVYDHVATLHGSVGTEMEAHEITSATLAVSGVRAVVSHLHVGLGAADSRPSAGRAVSEPSEARRRLVEAAASAGIPEPGAQHAVQAVLGALADRLPDAELAHLVGHLPDDVKPWCAKPRYLGEHVGPRTLTDWLDEVAGLGVRPLALTEEVALAVLHQLQALVPEEVADIAAVLPAELADLWKQATPAR